MKMRLPAITLTLFLLAGLAAAADTPDAAPANGGMIVRVLSNTATASRLFKNWGELYVARIEDEAAGKSNVFKLGAGVDGASHTAVFASELPAGHYRLTRLSSQACGWLSPCSWSWIEMNPGFSSFEVRAGQLTDLGVLLQSPGRRLRTVSLLHQVDPPHDLAPALVQHVAPKLVGLLGQPVLGWDASKVPAGMDDAFAQAVDVSYGVVSPSATSDGFIAGSMNGAVREWRANGTWTTHDTGVRVAVESVLAADGQWLAGGEFGTILRSTDGGANWSSLRGDLPYGLVGDLALWHGQVIATLLHGKTVAIEALRPDAAGAAHWVALAEYALKIDGYWASLTGDRPRSFLAGDRLVTSLPVDHVAVLDLASGRADVRECPSDINWVTASPDGAIHLRTQGTWLGMAGYESLDQAATWKKIDDQGLMKPPAIRADGHGVGFRGGFTVLAGKVQDGKFVTTDNGGASWTAGDKTTELFREFRYSPDGKTAFGITADGNVWRSEDDGHHWAPAS